MRTIIVNPSFYYSISSKRILVLNKNNNYIEYHGFCRELAYEQFFNSKYEKVIYLFCKSDKKDLIKTISKNFSLYKKQYFKLLKVKVNFHHTNYIVCYKKSSFYGISFSFLYKGHDYTKFKYYFKLPLLIARNAHKTKDNICNIFKSDEYNFMQEMNILKPKLNLIYIKRSLIN